MTSSVVAVRKGLKGFNANVQRLLLREGEDAESVGALDLSHNLLTSTQDLLSFTRLERLSLAHNQVKELFSLPSTLMELDLSYNCIEALFKGERSALSSLSSLVRLDLSHNRIAQLCAELLPPGSPVAFVDFSNNALKSNFRCFTALKNLKQYYRCRRSTYCSLDLSENQIADSSAVKGFEKNDCLETLLLGGNPVCL